MCKRSEDEKLRTSTKAAEASLAKLNELPQTMEKSLRKQAFTVSSAASKALQVFSRFSPQQAAAVDNAINFLFLLTEEMDSCLETQTADQFAESATTIDSLAERL
jgi:hypothetical protein